MLESISQPWLVTPEAPRTGYERIKALKKELHRNITDLLALSPVNDPFYAGSPASREKAEWFLALWEQFGFTRGVHLRRIHYRIVSVETPILKADGFAIRKYGRLLGLPLNRWQVCEILRLCRCRRL
jgi:hypothetical protein